MKGMDRRSFLKSSFAADGALAVAGAQGALSRASFLKTATLICLILFLGACEKATKEMPLITGIAEVNGAKLYYEQMGDGHPMILIHGFSVNTRMWDDQFENFAKYYKVVRYDVRGFGKSSIPEEPYSHSKDLSSLMEFLAIDKAYLIGLSMGGGIAIDFTVEYPEKVDALIPVDMALSGYKWSDEFVQRSFVKYPSIARNEGVSEAIQEWLDDPLFAPALKNSPVGKKLKDIVSSYSGFHLLNPDPQIQMEPPAIERLSEIRVPTLIVLGELDTPDFHLIADTLVSRIKGAKRIVIPDAGHIINMEKPAEFNKIVLDFLANI